MSEPAIAAIVLAAGLGSRYRAAAGEGAPPSKMLADWRGAPLVRHVAEAALGGGLSPVIVVTGHAGETVAAALAGLDVRCVDNPAYETGLASSLKAGVAALPAEVAGVVVLLGDMPAVSPALIARLVSAFRAAPDKAAVVPLVEGRRGNPVLLARALFPALATLEGDRGAGPLLAKAGASVQELPVEDTGAALDIDEPSALQSLR